MLGALTTCLVTLTLFGACSKDDDSGKSGDGDGDGASQTDGGTSGEGGAPAVVGEGEIDAKDGGTIQSEDGQLELTIPPGALAENTTIEVTPLALDEADDSWMDQTDELAVIYELSPDGLQFEDPALLSLKIDVAELADHPPEEGWLWAIISRGEEGQFEVLKNQVAFQESETEIVFEAAVEHFSEFGLALAGRIDLDLPCNDCTVGVDYTGTITVESHLRLLEAHFPSGIEATPEVYVRHIDEGDGDLRRDIYPPSAMVFEPEESRNTDFVYHCKAVQNVPRTLTAQGYVRFDPDLLPFLNNQGRLTVANAFEVINCQEPEAQDTVLTPGVHPFPTNFTTVTQPEVASRLPINWLGLPDGVIPVSVAGTGGFVFMDLVSGGDFDGSSGTPRTGVVGWSTNPDARLEYAPAFSAFSVYDPDPMFPGWNTNLDSSGPITDAYTIGGVTDSNGIVHANFGSNLIVVRRYDMMSAAFDDVTTVSSTGISAASAGSVVSAYMHNDDGPVLFVTEEAGPLTGQLLIHDLSSPTTAATLIGTIGNSPRRVRCLPPVCVATSFDNDRIERIVWDGMSLSPTIEGTTTVGDGPVGVDLLASGPNVLAVTTGSNDDTYTVTEIGSDGSEVTSTTTAVPSGCTGPAHPLWVTDDVSSKLMVTCNGSDNYAIIDPSP